MSATSMWAGGLLAIATVVGLPAADLVTPAAQLSVRVRPPTATATVVVVPIEDMSAAVEAVVRGAKLTVGTVVEGHAAVPVSPGLAYVIALAQGKVGIAGPLELKAGKTTVADVELKERPTVVFTASAATATAPPNLVVMLTPRVGERWFPNALVQAQLTGDAPASVSLPFPGTWRAQAFMADAGALTSVGEETLVADAAKASHVRFVTQMLTFTGSVSVDGKARPGMLRLRRAEARDSTRAVVGADGTFKALLPAPGDYKAEFRGSEDPIRGTALVSCLDPGTPVTVDVGTTVISGRVVRPDGSAAAGATVTAKAADLDDVDALNSLPVSTKSDSKGSFTLFADEREWEIRAALDSQVSEPEIVVLRSRDVENVRLVLEDATTVRGRVLDAAGYPVPGARGEAFAEASSSGQVPGVISFSSDTQGYFSFVLDRPARKSVHAIAIAPGRPVTVFRLTGATDKPIELRLAAVGGELRIVFPRSPEAPTNLPPEADLYLLVNAEGGMLSFPIVFSHRAAFTVQGAGTATIVLPSLAPGRWRLVKFDDLRSGMLFLAGASAAQTVGTFDVRPGATTTFEVR